MPMAHTDHLALEEFFHAFNDRAGDVDLTVLHQKSPIAWLAFEKAIGVLRVYGFTGSQPDYIENTVRAYLMLFETLTEIDPAAPWADIVAGPPRVCPPRKS
jgi:hypothetical protein